MVEASSWIAIVDDDPAVLEAVNRLLRSRGFQTQCFGSGREFLAALANGLPACLIVDFQMPDMNGLEVRRHLLSKVVKIPTILITGHEEAASSGVVEADLVASLRKPVPAAALFSAIGRAVDGVELVLQTQIEQQRPF